MKPFLLIFPLVFFWGCSNDDSASFSTRRFELIQIIDLNDNSTVDFDFEEFYEFRSNNFFTFERFDNGNFEDFERGTFTKGRSSSMISITASGIYQLEGNPLSTAPPGFYLTFSAENQIVNSAQCRNGGAALTESLYMFEFENPETMFAVISTTENCAGDFRYVYQLIE